MDKKEFSEEEIDFIAARAAVYISAATEAYNKELQNIDKTSDRASLEATAALSALAAITLSIITSITGNIDDLCTVLTDHIDALDKILLTVEEAPREAYKAIPEAEGSIVDTQP
jgi:hypothetical protein